MQVIACLNNVKSKYKLAIFIVQTSYILYVCIRKTEITFDNQ